MLIAAALIHKDAITIIKTAAITATRGPFDGQSFESKLEMLAALEALNQEPNDHPEWVQPPRPSKKAPETYTILRASF